MVFGIVIAVMNKLRAKSGGVKRKSFECGGCPVAGNCSRTSCDYDGVKIKKERKKNA